METFLTDDGAPAVGPSGTGEIEILGGTGVDVTGQGPGNIVTVSADSSVATSYFTDSGTAIPAANILNVSGTEFLSTAGVGNTATFDLTTNAAASAVHGWNGSIVETPAVTVASDGATITLSVQKSGGGNLTVITSLGYVTWVTAPDTVALTPGTDTVPVENYVYWLESTATLTASTAGFPVAEHAPIATVVCQTAATTVTNLPMKVHAWTDHTTTTYDQGHIGDINHWIRHQNATWKSAVTQTYTITPQGGAADNVTINTVAGEVAQLHDHTFPAFAGGHDYYVANDFTTPYKVVTDLNTLLTDSKNASMSGKYFTLVMWGVVSEDTTDCKIFINLPSGSYNTSSNVTADPNKYANFSIPEEYKGCGFLISQWNLRHQVAASGTWTSINEVDLRGFFPGVSGGSGTAASTQFPDTTFRVFDDGDATKLMAFQVSGLTTATTRTLTVQDADGIIALSGVANYGTGATTLTDHGVLVGSGTAAITPLAAATNGQLIIGSTGADPAVATLASADGSVTITNGAGTIDLAAAGGGLAWALTTVNASIVAGNGYIANKAGLLSMALPATSAVGDQFGITNINTAVGWRITQGANQYIRQGFVVSTVGVGGYVEATALGDGGTLVCTETDLGWIFVPAPQGNLTTA